MSLEAHLDARERAASGALPPASVSDELRRTLDAALAELSAGLGGDVAVFTVGGTGLGRLGAFTDVDVAVLSLRPVAADAVRPFLLPLWDAGLKVGHSVRTVKETARAARDDVTIACGLTTRRQVAGDPEIGAKLDRALRKSLSRPDAHIEQIVAEERARRVSDPYRSTRPDLKHGRGGLRTIDLARWVRALRSETIRVEPDPELDRIEDELVAVRQALHAAVGAKRDVLEIELLQPVGEQLGAAPRDLARRVLGMLDDVERLVDERVVGIGPIWPPVADRPRQEPTSPTMAQAVEAARGGPGPSTEGTMAWSRADRDALRWLLRSMPGREVVQDLRRRGWMDRAVPELSNAWLEPHLVPFHAHPVGGHSLRVFAELQTDPEFLDSTADEREVLEWAALFHDIGKGGGGDHSELGARRFAAVAARLRIPAAIASRSRRLIRHHLLLADIGTRLDPNDREVRRRAAADIGDNASLRLLAILTAADSRATGTDTWNAWRRSLIAQAAAAVEAELRGVNLAGPVVAHLAHATGKSEAKVVEHLAGMPDVYRTNNPLPRIARHIDLVEGEGLRWTAAVEPSHTEIALVAPDRPGLVADVAGALAVHRCSVVDARCNDRSDDLAVDTFVVIDALGGPPPDEARIAAAMSDVERAWTGAFDIADAVASKAHDYRSRVTSGLPITVDTETGDGVVVFTIECADRVGLLHALAATIHAHGGSIQRAHLDTVGGMAHDTFEVRGLAEPTKLGEALSAAAVPPK